jgi:hypothetical protein
MELTETYKRRLAVSESVYSRTHDNAPLDGSRKAEIARVLANTSAYLNEAFSNSVGTQRGDMHEFKKFALDLTTVALPNLIANELVVVKPMSSFTGYIQYIKFVAGSNKGGIKQGDEFNSPFALGAMSDDRAAYTGNAMVEDVTVGTAGVTQLAWFPIATSFTPVLVGAESGASIAVTDAENGKVTITGIAAGETAKVKYVYDNVRIPQNDLPIYNAKMEGIALEAKPRRIAIYYSQMAAFQAKQEMGMDLGEVLATQACAELSYEIDTEVVKLLVSSAPTDATLTFNKTLPVGVSKMEHYAGFAEIIEQGSQIIYDRTQKYRANYMIAASSILPILSLMIGWKPAGVGKNTSGPFFAGTINGIKVFVSPAVTKDTFTLGFNGDDLVTSAAVFAPYMAIVPTSLLQYADGGSTQGFSTLYDLKLLNSMLLVSGKVVAEPQIVETHTNA